MRSRLPLWLVIASLATVLSAVSGCGVRGPLDAPPRAIADEPPTRPGEPKPHKPSVLDSLIR